MRAIFFLRQKPAYEIAWRLVGSEMYIRNSYKIAYNRRGFGWGGAHGAMIISTSQKHKSEIDS